MGTLTRRRIQAPIRMEMFRRISHLLFGALCLVAGAAVSPHLPGIVSSEPTTRTVSDSVVVHFSPKGGCTEAVVCELEKAQKAVLVQAYSFTSEPIAAALVKAFRRGVDVQVILDKSQRGEKYSSADFVAHAQIPTFIDAKHSIAHNKVMIIDWETVITGSFNFTKAAEDHNAENLLVIHDPNLAGQYAENWKMHLGHSEAYVGR